MLAQKEWVAAFANRPARLQRERRRILHDSLPRRLELHHLIACADGDANMSGHAGPYPPNAYLLLRHGIDHFFSRAIRLQQEAIRFRTDVGITVPVEPVKGFLANAGVNAPAFGN